MRIIEFDDPRAFRDRTLAYLLESEAERCVELGIVDRLIAGATTSGTGRPLAQPRLWVAEDGGKVEAIAVQTIADRMIVSRAPTAAMQAIARHLQDTNWDGRSLVGVSPSIGELVEGFSSLSGRTSSLAIRLWTMALQKVIDPAPAPGFMRQCDEGDFDLLGQWSVDFAREIGEAGDDGARMAHHLLKEKRAFFWIDDGPRAMAARTGPTPNGIRISFVYTPPEHRRKGYASNLVAHLSKRLLGEGRKFCFLTTDQSNPTSNRIYESIGYARVCETQRWELAPL